MKTAAIIAEYNPFHAGHRYQIEQTRKETGADYILVLMSGDFVQRGEPAIYNKYVRTRMALLGGADAVLELPALYAASSAEFFAEGAVTLLHSLGMVDFLSFGSESGQLQDILSPARLLYQEESAILAETNALLKKGLSYPEARSRALIRLFPGQTPSDPAFFSSPNNILGLEYCKTLQKLKSTITPFTLKRKGSGYHDSALPQNSSFYPSASALRSAIISGSSLSGQSFSVRAASDSTPDSGSVSGRIPGGSSASDKISGDVSVSDRIPGSVLNLDTYAEFLTADDFSSQLFYKLLCEKDQGFSGYLDCSQALSDRICKFLPSYTCYTDFCTLLKSREFTYTRVSRTLLHILLNLKTPEFYAPAFSSRFLKVPYARLLGFRKESAPLLSLIKKHSQIPLVSKLADARALLSDDALQMLNLDIFAATLYESALFLKYASAGSKWGSAAEPLPESTASDLPKSAASESFCSSCTNKGLLNEYQQSPVIL